MSKPDRTTPKYIERVLEKLNASPLGPGKVLEVRVVHENWCQIFKKHGECSCQPVITEPREPERAE